MNRTTHRLLGISLSIICFQLLSANLYAQSAKEPKVFFRDDFTGTSLKPQWSAIGADPDRLMLHDEHLLIVTTGESRGVAFAGKLPRNYEITTKFIRPEAGSTNIELILDGERKGNWLDLQLYGNIYFKKSLKGKESYHEVRASPSPEVYFRLVKSGFEYSGYYKGAAGDWQKIGTAQIFKSLNVKSVRLLAKGTPEVPVKFDYFEIKGWDDR